MNLISHSVIDNIPLLYKEQSIFEMLEGMSRKWIFFWGVGIYLDKMKCNKDEQIKLMGRTRG